MTLRVFSVAEGALELRTAKRPLQSRASEAQKQAALRYILDAWEEALHDGIEPETLANAALFAALADFIESMARMPWPR